MPSRSFPTSSHCKDGPAQHALKTAAGGGSSLVALPLAALCQCRRRPRTGLSNKTSSLLSIVSGYLQHKVRVCGSLFHLQRSLTRISCLSRHSQPLFEPAVMWRIAGDSRAGYARHVRMPPPLECPGCRQRLEHSAVMDPTKVVPLTPEDQSHTARTVQGRKGGCILANQCYW